MRYTGFKFREYNYTPMSFDVPIRALYCVYGRVKRQLIIIYNISAEMNVYIMILADCLHSDNDCINVWYQVLNLGASVLNLSVSILNLDIKHCIKVCI